MKFLIVTDGLNFVGGGFEPVSVLQLASALRATGHEVRMVPDQYKKCASVISSWQPDFIGYSLFTGWHNHLLNLNRRLKEDFKFHAVFGGPHATFFPEIIEEEGVDLVCRGEGEEAMLEMMDRIGQNQDYCDVKNFWIKYNGEIYKNPVRPLVSDIERFPPPAHDLFYQFPKARYNKIRLFMTARGCPYACTYCYNYRLRDLYSGCGVNLLRHRDVGSVIEEIRQVKDNYPVELVYFATDCFTALEKWVFEFCEQYRRSINIPFTATTHPNSTTDSVCQALKEAGCVCLYMGIESGNEEMRQQLLKRRMSNEKILEAAEKIHAAGLYLFTFNMMALPGETVEQAYETMDLNIKAKTDYTWISIFQPYPRTKLADYTVEKGYFDGNYDNVPISWYRNSVLKNPQKKQLERLRTLATLAVEFPRVVRLVKLLVKLPLGGLYHILWKIHKAYCYRFRVMPVKLTLREIISLGWSYIFDRTS